MLDSLHIENFRMFKHLDIERLGHVNLITGRNNCGKSTLLEALRIWAKKGSPQILQELAESHDETSRPNYSQDSSDGESSNNKPFRDFFTGRIFPEKEGGGIYIGNMDNSNYVRIDHTYYIDQIEEVVDSSGETLRRRKRIPVPKTRLLNDDPPPEQALQVTTSETPGVGWIDLSDTPRRPPFTMFWERLSKDIPISYVPTRFLSMEYLAQLWDNILFSPYAEDVKSVLKIIDNQFEDIAFVDPSSFNSSRSLERERLGRRPRAERAAVVKLSSSKNSIPLNSMGDGMLRALQLGLTVFPAKDGILLIDEFENGLHWSVQEKIWESIFRLSTELNIQIFVTTHSNDAIQSFGRASEKSNNEGALIRLIRRELENKSNQIEGIIYNESMLKTAIDAEVEIR